MVVLRRAVRLWRDTGPFERLQVTPVYVFSLLTFALVTIAQAGASDAAFWPAFISTALMPFAYLAGLLRSHVIHLDHELQAHIDELRGGAADEAPSAYKRLDGVLVAHGDTIEVLHRLTPIGVAMAGADTFDPYKD